MAASHDREAFIDARRTDTMTALHFEIRVAGTVPADVLAELDDVRINYSVRRNGAQRPRPGPGRADRHHQPTAGLGHRTPRGPATRTVCEDLRPDPNLAQV